MRWPLAPGPGLALGPGLGRGPREASRASPEGPGLEDEGPGLVDEGRPSAERVVKERERARAVGVPAPGLPRDQGPGAATGPAGRDCALAAKADCARCKGGGGIGSVAGRKWAGMSGAANSTSKNSGLGSCMKSRETDGWSRPEQPMPFKPTITPQMGTSCSSAAEPDSTSEIATPWVDCCKAMPIRPGPKVNVRRMMCSTGGAALNAASARCSASKEASVPTPNAASARCSASK